jgi:hypothetical protein
VRGQPKKGAGKAGSPSGPVDDAEAAKQLARKQYQGVRFALPPDIRGALAAGARRALPAAGRRHHPNGLHAHAWPVEYFCASHLKRLVSDVAKVSVPDLCAQRRRRRSGSGMQARLLPRRRCRQHPCGGSTWRK